MKKTSKFAALGLTAGLAAGGAAGLVLAVPAVSGAQSTTSTTAPADTGTKPDPSSRIAGALAPLVSDGTIPKNLASCVVLESQFKTGANILELSPADDANWQKVWQKFKAGA